MPAVSQGVALSKGFTERHLMKQPGTGREGDRVQQRGPSEATREETVSPAPSEKRNALGTDLGRDK